MAEKVAVITQACSEHLLSHTHHLEEVDQKHCACAQSAGGNGVYAHAQPVAGVCAKADWYPVTTTPCMALAMEFERP